MRTEKIAEELNQIQIEQARQLSQLANMFSLNGETGVMLWLNQQQTDIFAIDIIEHFGLTAGRVANIVKKLEQKGYITREHNIEDLRKSHITLTRSGIDYANEQYSLMNENHMSFIKSLGEEDAGAALRIIKLLLSQK